MNADREAISRLLDFIVELLDIPPSHYQKAVDRYTSLAEWLHRNESKVVRFSPEVFTQGSFRYGTVIPPLLRTDEYDLDLVCQLFLSKTVVTQQQLKSLIGDEIKSYAEAHSFKDPPEETPRCWRLNYADHVSFHMDILPSIPEDVAFIDMLVQSGVPSQLAATAVAITDNRHPKYTVVDPTWFSSNPRGFARWFEDRMRPVARARMLSLVAKRVYASVDDVPTYEWKTPLQYSIQILKRHRDVMFKDSSDWKPLSVIIATLAAHAYNGETDLHDALTHIVENMPKYVRSIRPRIMNPVNPAEDFADRWTRDERHEQNFWAWHTQIGADLKSLTRLTGNAFEIARAVRRTFAIDLTPEMEKELGAAGLVSGPTIITSPHDVHITSAPKPWGVID